MEKLVFSNHIRLIYYTMGKPSVSTADSSPYRENPSGKIGDFATSPYRGGFFVGALFSLP